MSNYISREDALKSIDTHDASVREDVRLHSEDFYEFKGGIDYAWKIIKHEVPSADVGPVVHAHWEDLNHEFIELDEDGCPTHSAWCSRCHEWLTGSEEYGCRGCYCPNCGAKMDEVIK